MKTKNENKHEKTICPNQDIIINDVFFLSSQKNVKVDHYKEQDMEEKRTIPEFITELEPNEIFVFGSNLEGMHGGGAAYIAYRMFGAIMG